MPGPQDPNDALDKLREIQSQLTNMPTLEKIEQNILASKRAAFTGVSESAGTYWDGWDAACQMLASRVADNQTAQVAAFLADAIDALIEYVRSQRV